MNIQGFYTGREFDADTFFGAHPYEGGTHFAVWAPSARDVKVITSGLSDGSWAEWQMHRSYSGCWEADAAGAPATNTVCVAQTAVWWTTATLTVRP
jgi:1,4-alpha-glucan branching enzyme